MQNYKAEKDCFFIAHEPLIHYGELKEGCEVSTGQTNLEIFENNQDYNAKLIELGIILEEEEEEEESL